MLPPRDTISPRAWPLVTLTLVGLNILIYLWDRGFRPTGESVAFADLAMRPRELTLVVMGRRGDFFELGKVFTSLFLHATWWHLLINMLFLGAFGPKIEQTLGSWRFALYFLFWGVAGAAAHLAVHPHSAAPVLGASGAIGGILGCYFLLYPAHKVNVFYGFGSRELPAAALLGVWFLLQILAPADGVANWAHVGGFAAGMLTVLVMGGRTKALRDLKMELQTQ